MRCIHANRYHLTLYSSQYSAFIFPCAAPSGAVAAFEKQDGVFVFCRLDVHTGGGAPSHWTPITEQVSFQLLAHAMQVPPALLRRYLVVVFWGFERISIRDEQRSDLSEEDTSSSTEND